MKSDEADRIGLAPPQADIIKIDVTPDPAGGRGFSLNEQGHIPVVEGSGQTWTERILSGSLDIGNTAAGAGGNVDMTVTGVRVGDFVEIMGAATNGARQFALRPRLPVSADDTVTIDFVNASTGTIDPGAFTLYLKVNRGASV